MNEHDSDADFVQDADLFDDRAGRFGGYERLAACFQHEHLAFEHPDVRRRVF